jgi:uncharacterized protein YukE
MGQIRVDPGALEAGGRRLGATSDELVDQAVRASGLRASGSGNGTCDAALGDMVSTWAHQLGHLADVLVSLAQATTASGVVYADTDENAFKKR